MTKEDTNPRTSLYKKLNMARKKMQTLDWSDDKYMSAGSQGYSYLSNDKIKRNIASVFPDCGLEFTPEFCNPQKLEPIGNLSQHWLIQLKAHIIDIDTCEEDVTEVFGEAASTGDKGMTIAQAYAQKNWITTKFFVTDGMDPDATSTAVSAKFVPKTPEENMEIQSKVVSAGVKPTPKMRPKAEPEGPVNTVSSKSTAKPLREPEVVPFKLDEMEEAKSNDLFSIPAPYTKMVENIEDEYRRMAESGEIDAEVYNGMSADRVDIKDLAGVMKFIEKYKVGA